MKKKLPKISIITPSFNQSRFIRKTIESVLSQNYPYLEYIVEDGGSTDGTVDILRQYSGKIIWSSRKDKGQSQAINRGLRKTSGEIVGYLNSDDYLEEGALLKIGNFFTEHPEAFWMTGKCKVVDEKDDETRRIITVYKNILLRHFRQRAVLQMIQFISQPSTFWRRSVVGQIGKFDESLHYDMDYDYWLRIWQKYELYYLDDYLSCYRVHNLAKAVRSPETQFSQEYEIVRRYAKSRLILWFHRFHSLLALSVYKLFFIKNRWAD
jgi:glycosyltransferase involved in cell wall biosynthesis